VVAIEGEEAAEREARSRADHRRDLVEEPAGREEQEIVLGHRDRPRRRIAAVGAVDDELAALLGRLEQGEEAEARGGVQAGDDVAVDGELEVGGVVVVDDPLALGQRAQRARREPAPVGARRPPGRPPASGASSASRRAGTPSSS
jgi:hypothetical protein